MEFRTTPPISRTPREVIQIERTLQVSKWLADQVIDTAHISRYSITMNRGPFLKLITQFFSGTCAVKQHVQIGWRLSAVWIEGVEITFLEEINETETPWATVTEWKPL
tara:strand:+ start:2920 stop:3243 length:324 start_codon:yes stop_codon:yes gene_type:complete